MSQNLTEHYFYMFFSTKNHNAQAQNKINHRISKNLIISWKDISEECFLFNGNVNASLKSLLKVPTQKEKFNLHKNQTYLANLKPFSNHSSVSASKLSSLKSSLPFLSLFTSIKHLLIISILFQSYLISYSGTQSAFKDSAHSNIHIKRRTLEGHSDTQRVLEHSEST